MSRISQETRQELTIAVAARYREATRREKTVILDEFVRITGYHRKHAIRLLRGDLANSATPVKRSLRRTYDEAVRQALVVLWEASDRICGKRLKSLLPLLLESLTRHQHLDLDEEVRRKLLRMSASTMDRLLAPARSTGKPRRRSPPAVRGHIPVRTFAEWGDPLPGFMEVDLVAHCGGVASGRYNHTLVLTDISSGWTECLALAVRDSSLVVRGLESLASAMPFPLRGVDTDNGGEFVNESVLKFGEAHGIELTRSRPFKKNDQAWVEQMSSRDMPDSSAFRDAMA